MNLDVATKRRVGWRVIPAEWFLQARLRARKIDDAGNVVPGSRLITQQELAARLGVSVGLVSNRETGNTDARYLEGYLATLAACRLPIDKWVDGPPAEDEVEAPGTAQ